MEEPGSITAAALTPALLGALVYQTGVLRETFFTLYTNYNFTFLGDKHPATGAFLGTQLKTRTILAEVPGGLQTPSGNSFRG